MTDAYDLFVIGAGSGGVRAARLAGEAGAKVAIAEEDRIGGTCVIRGCVPKKLLVYGADYAQSFRDAERFGWTTGEKSFDWPTLRDNVQAEVSRVSAAYERNMDKAGVEMIADRATIVDANTVRLERAGKTLKAKRILVATGGKPIWPVIKGAEHAISSNEAFTLAELPKRIVIAGGGYIAAEFATIFSGLGVETTLVYRGPLILRGFDDDLRAYVQSEFERTGIKVVTNTVITEIASAGGAKRVKLSDHTQLDADQVMFAVGREPNTAGLGLEAAGVELTERGAVVVDAHSASNIPSIFAVGDVTDRINLTPVAIREAQAFVATEFHNRPTAYNHADVPSAVFSRPPIGAVGMTEAQARAEYGDAHIYKTLFRPMKHVVAGNEQRALMKLVVHDKTERILGVHIAGPEAPEMVQVAAIAVKAGLTKTQWDETTALHPTIAEELVLMRDKQVSPQAP